MIQPPSIYLAKAIESLQGAESEYANGRYHNCANWCYYACFQAAVHALDAAGISAGGSRGTWSHEAVQSSFVRELINQRKRYPADLRDVLTRTYTLRQAADYTLQWVSDIQALRALRRARMFVMAIRGDGGTRA